MAILERFCIDDLEQKVNLLPWQEAGLQYTASGYGHKIPTARMVRLPGDNGED